MNDSFRTDVFQPETIACASKTTTSTYKIYANRKFHFKRRLYVNELINSQCMSDK